MTVRRWVIGLALTLFSMKAHAAQAPGSGLDLVEVDRRIQTLMQRTDMVGLSVGIIQDGKIAFVKGYGETLSGSGDAVTEDTVFRWASVSKGVAAAAALSLVDEGYFGLTSPIIAYAPSLKLPPSKYHVTVEDILSHRTGIVRNAYDIKIEDGQSAQAVRGSLETLPRICEPGQCYSYQNVAFDSVAEVIEKTTGLPYKSVVHARLFKPLGMSTASSTRIGLTRSKSWAKPHNRNGDAVDRVKDTYYRLPAAAGVNASVKDLTRWVQAQMDTDIPGLSPSQRDALQKPRVSTPRENTIMRRSFPSLRDAHYGLGWRMYDYDGHRVVGHRGAVEGYRAAVMFDPEIKAGVAILWNSPQSRPVGLQLEIMDQFYGFPRRDWMRLGPK